MTVCEKAPVSITDTGAFGGSAQGSLVQRELSKISDF